jgi:hypothetical protein
MDKKILLHSKKRLAVFPSQPGYHLPNSLWPGIIKLFPARESLVSDIPAGDEKIANLFYSVPAVLFWTQPSSYQTLWCDHWRNVSEQHCSWPPCYIAGVPGVVVVLADAVICAVDSAPAVSGIPAVAGVPAIAGALAIALILLRPYFRWYFYAIFTMLHFTSGLSE